MITYVRVSDVLKDGKATGHTLLDERHGCVNGSKCGISCYEREEYREPGSHDDQEGFLVLEGFGTAWIDGQEIPLEPGICFMVPAHTPHTMKKSKDCPVCKVFWFHAAV